MTKIVFEVGSGHNRATFLRRDWYNRNLFVVMGEKIMEVYLTADPRLSLDAVQNSQGERNCATLALAKNCNSCSLLWAMLRSCQYWNAVVIRTTCSRIRRKFR